MAQRGAAPRGGQQLMSGCFRSAAHIVVATIDCICETKPYREVLYFRDRGGGTKGEILTLGD